MKENQKKYEHYSIGLDIGTNSVGYAVTDEQGEIIQFRKKNMLGSRLFEAGESAKDCRINRNTRRRYNRRKERVALLQQLMATDVLAVDENFFARLKEGFLQTEDKKIVSKSILFNDEEFTDSDYYDKYKTIYHLRKDLLYSNEKADIRMIYLALHHMVKYRGNFLFQGQKIESINKQIDVYIEDVIAAIREYCEVDISLSKSNISAITETLKNSRISKREKCGMIENEIKSAGADKKMANALALAFLGYSFSAQIVFNDSEIVDDSGKPLKIEVGSKDYEMKEEEYLSVLGERSVILEGIRKIYSWYILQDILKGNAYISEAMLDKYNIHKKHLSMLKTYFKNNCSGQEYNDFFRNEYNGDKYIKNYYNYVSGAKRCNQEEFYDAIKKIIGKNDNNAAKEILTLIEDGAFMPLLNSVDNAAIPYQLNKIEMEKILDNQSTYYPVLKENKDKIISILEFKIPYYVGPMNANSRFAWIERRDEKIYPWNYTQVIDIDKTAEKFIRRMTNKCTYFPQEDVIPANSLLYSKYKLLNELNKIRINGKLIPSRSKKKIIEELFMQTKTVKEKTLINYLKKINYMNSSEYEVSGYQKDKEFASSLGSYIDFKRIFGNIDENNTEMIEKIIYWLTIFEEKDIVKTKIRQNYKEDQITDAQLAKVIKLKYTGWSELSEKLLVGIKSKTGNGPESTVMDVLDATNLNLMQIINSKDYEFKSIIENARQIRGTGEIEYEEVNELHCSPAIKRSIWQSVKIVKELVEIMGHEPTNIFVEFAREEGKKVRTTTRQKMIKQAYEKLKDDVDEHNDALNNSKKLDNKQYSNKLDQEKMLLYFIQNGKSLYSGKKLDIDRLSEYEVDHIIPQSYIKDDSIENKALVLKGENQEKSDALLIASKYRTYEQKKFWKRLFECNLIGAKKYNNLLKETVSENDVVGFINRQLVETRQITKNVAILLNQRYVNSNVVAIRAELSHNLREKYELYKCREINDFHHAHDAYLASVLGTFILIKYPKLENEFIYDTFRREYNKNKDSRKNRHGFVLYQFGRDLVDEDGVVLWNSERIIANTRSILQSFDCRVTKKVEENTGIFYKDTKYRKGSKDAQIPLKKGLDVKKYGGYTGRNIAYSVIIEYKKKNKTVKQVVGIPLYICVNQNDEMIMEYLKNEYAPDVRIISKEKILKYQLIEINGNLLYMTSDAEVINARQMCFGEKYVHLNKAVSKALTGKYKSDEKEELGNTLNAVYLFLKEKLHRKYTLFDTTTDNIYCNLKFEEKTFEDKVTILREILKLTAVGAEYPNLSKFGLKDRMGRKSGFNIKVEDTEFIYQSITGLYENRRKY